MSGDGGPAFPKPAFYAPGTVEDGLYNEPEDGMSLRDWFAGLAMQAYISCADGQEVGADARQDPAKCAAWAFEHADAMLKARNQ